MCYQGKANLNGIEDQEVRDKIEAFCDELKKRMLDKFDKGRLEHGDNLLELDVAREIEEELVDIHIYGIIEKMQKSLKE